MPGYWVSGIGVVLLLWRVNAVQPRCDAQQGPIAANRNGSSCVAWSQTCADCRRPDLIFLSSFSTLWPRIDRHGIGRMSIYQVTMQVPCQALTINGLADCADLNVNFADSPGGPMGWNGAVAHGAFTYSFVKNVRDRRKGPAAGRRPTFEALVKSVRGDGQHNECAIPTDPRVCRSSGSARHGAAQHEGRDEGETA